jgi:hypothetical protein
VTPPPLILAHRVSLRIGQTTSVLYELCTDGMRHG